MKSQKLKGNLILLLTSFIWGTSFIAQSKGVEEISPFAFNGVRSVLGGLVLIPVIIFMSLYLILIELQQYVEDMELK